MRRTTKVATIGEIIPYIWRFYNVFVGLCGMGLTYIPIRAIIKFEQGYGSVL